MGQAPSDNQQHPQEADEKKFTCTICDKNFKHTKGVKDHMKRIHKLDAHGNPLPGDTGEGIMMEPQHPEMNQMNPSPGKKKGRPRKHAHQGQGRPIGQVFGTVQGTPRPPHDLKEGPEPSRPPVQQDRGASPMSARQRPQGIMSPSGAAGMMSQSNVGMIPQSNAGMISPSNAGLISTAMSNPAGMMSPSGPSTKRSMAPQNILGPGMRPRGPHPQQFQQQPHPMDIRKLGKKLGGAISITSSDHQPPQQPSMRRPMPSTSRMHTSSPKSDPLATPGGRPPSIPSQRLSQEAVEVKEEPIDDDYYDGEEIPEDDYDEEGEEGDGYGEEEEEEDDEQDYGQASFDGMYGGEAPYDDDVEHDGGAYQQQ